MSSHDPQAQRVDAAEESVIDDVGRRFTRWSQVERFVDGVLGDDLFHEQFENAPLEITLERRSRSATASLADAGRAVIWIRDGSWDALTVLHELAHIARPSAEPHGPVFVATELELVRLFCGFDAYIALRAAFEQHDVRS